MDQRIEILEQELIDKNEELQAIAEKYFVLYDNSPDMYVSVDPIDATIKNCNQTTANKTGYTKEEIIGQSIFFLYHPDCLSEVKKAFHTFVDKGRVENAELELKRKDGSKIAVFLKAESITDNNGKVIYSNSCWRDISEIKELQNQLIETNKSLEKRNHELSQFAYIASHDLQEPLRSIRNFTHLLTSKYSCDVGEVEQKSLQFITEAADRMSHLVKDLLDHSRIGNSNPKTLIDCNSLIQQVQKDLYAAIRETGALITVDSLPQISGYETDLRLLFQNLLSNSIKFRQADTRPEIKVFAEKKEQHWKFTIKDNGIGIPKKDQKKIFLIFRRLHLNSQYEGTGIGLAHCKKIVDLHGGEIWVDSQPLQGTSFHFTLPH